MNKAQVIGSSSVLSSVSPSRRQALASIGRAVRFAKGETIFRQDDPVPGMFIVASGLVRVYKIGPSGKEHTLHLAVPGQTFAEVACIAGFACPAWAEAVDATEALVLPTAGFTAMLRQDHALCLELLTGMGSWVRHLTGLLEDIVLRDASSRVARQLEKAPKGPDGACELVGLRKHLASQLNLTAETLSRTLHRFAEAGVIEMLNDQRIRVVDLRALSAMGGE
jgi:CRP/FNR family transcriptional regulator, dissimilatory nitrate respiration regulator